MIAGLVAGVLLGILASVSGSPALLALIRFVEPLGTIFVNAIRMAVVPLVVASLIGGIVSITDERSLTRLGVRSLIVFAALAVSAAVFATLIAAPVLARLDIDPSVAEGLRAIGYGAGAQHRRPHQVSRSGSRTSFRRIP